MWSQNQNNPINTKGQGKYVYTNKNILNKYIIYTDE